MPAELLSIAELFRGEVERGRRLLAESAEFRGSSDLQLFVEGVDLTVQRHAIFVDGDGQQRQGLTAQEMQQGLVVVAQLALRTLPAAFNTWMVQGECFCAVYDACHQVAASPLAWWRLLGDTALAALMSLFTTSHDGDQALAALRGNLRQAGAMVATWRQGIDAVAGLLAEHQRGLGFAPLLTAADAHRLWLHVAHDAAIALLSRGPGAPEAPQWLAAALAANRQLAEADPGNAAFVLMRRADLLCVHQAGTGEDAVAAYRSSMRKAQERKAYLLEVAASVALAGALTEGAGGPRWSVEEVCGLLAASRRALEQCEEWLPGNNRDALRDAIALHQQWLDAAAARSPGQDTLPAAGEAELPDTQPSAPQTCSRCGQDCKRVRKCKGCLSAAYCSRRCQSKHWRKGGHQKECAKLARRRAAQHVQAGAGSPASLQGTPLITLKNCLKLAAALIALCLLALFMLLSTTAADAWLEL